MNNKFMNTIMKIIVIVAMIVGAIFIALIFAKPSQAINQKEKIDKEVIYLDTKILMLINSLNNINLQNYQVSMSKIEEKNSSNEEQSGSSSGNKESIAKLKKDVAIWNINSFAEFYMQIEEKYRKDYAVALERFRKERKRYADELSQVKGLRVLPSQANYLMLEITNGMSSVELTKHLLLKHNILIKDLHSKVTGEGKQYVRVAVKRTEENDLLIKAFKEEMEE